MYAFFSATIALIEASRYGLLFIGTLFGSPVVMVAAGYLVSINQLEFFPAYLTIVSADIIGDVAWYWIGRVGARRFLLRFGHLFGLNEEIIEKLEGRFLRYHERILVISKLTMGFGFAIATLAVAGMLRVPFWRYLGINLSGELLWALIPIGIGFYYGNVTNLLPPSFRLVFFLIGLFIMILAMRYVTNRIKKADW